MAGKLGTAAPPAATYTTLATIPKDMTINIRGVNRDQINAVTIRLAISPAATAPAAPAVADYIEPLDLVLPAGGVLEETGIAVSQGEVVTVFNSAATVTWRAHGR
jgi:hypothetical protein